MKLPRTLNNHPMPPTIGRLPRNPQGYPIPWFAAQLPDGTHDLRTADAHKLYMAARFGNCWICGRRTGIYKAFPIGPMCMVNRITAEPPSHRECAIYAAKVCPFLAVPQARRRDHDYPDGYQPAAGLPITTNPGVTVVWITKTFTTFRPPHGNDGLLFELGDPTETLFYRRGITADPVDVMAAMWAGRPALEAVCDLDPDPDASRRALERQFAKALTHIPQENQ